MQMLFEILPYNYTTKKLILVNVDLFERVMTTIELKDRSYGASLAKGHKPCRGAVSGITFRP
jgi:hypothetical protein